MPDEPLIMLTVTDYTIPVFSTGVKQVFDK